MILLRYNQEPVKIDFSKVKSILAWNEFSLKIIFSDNSYYIGYLIKEQE